MRPDPAVSSGPLITTLNDVLSLAIYFAIASPVVAMMQAWAAVPFAIPVDGMNFYLVPQELSRRRTTTG